MIAFDLVPAQGNSPSQFQFRRVHMLARRSRTPFAADSEIGAYFSDCAENNVQTYDYLKTKSGPKPSDIRAPYTEDNDLKVSSEPETCQHMTEQLSSFTWKLKATTSSYCSRSIRTQSFRICFKVIAFVTLQTLSSITSSIPLGEEHSVPLQRVGGVHACTFHLFSLCSDRSSLVQVYR